ncbi:CHAD domain-containing protein [Prauserella oleivorans]|uniref:CHAD domain-containing protein n=1 Tax=Prauserella oleivorans TaxID=1478153 RepID=A0ABW5WG93_9PSEU
MPNVSPPRTLTWQGPPTRGEPAAVLAALEAGSGRRYTLSTGPRRVRTVTYADTVDWRLRRKGIALAHQRASGPGSLTVSRDGDSGGAAVTVLTELPQWPARVEQLPDGEARDAVAAAMWVRAVAPVVRARTVTREVAVLDEDDKTVVRLEWTEVTGMEPVRTEPFTRVSVLPLLGYDKDAKRVAKALRATGEFADADADLYGVLLAAAGLPPEPRGAEIARGMPADIAVATALRAFADSITANVDGVLADVDTEFLHELRVAVRRTRTLLKLAGDLLPSPLAGRYAPGFKWLGDVTTPTRDLDVYLLELDELAASLVAAEPEHLHPFAEHLHAEREKARRALARSLKSQRFTRLLDGWRAGLTSLIEQDRSEPDELPTVEALVARRLTRTAAKVTRKAAAITPESPAEAVHDLRKRCKELRYLLEFAKPLCAEAEHAAVLKKLKKLQDILGDFQDGEVQSQALRAFAERMQERGRPPAATLLAMGELAGNFAVKQARARHELTAALQTFLGQDMRERIEALLP